MSCVKANMRNPNMLWLRIAVGFAPVVIAQLSGWEANQVSATMCTWLGQRGKFLFHTSKSFANG